MRFASTTVIINPPFATKQAGHLSQTEKISAVHDDLHARLLYLDDGNQSWLHVSLDNLGMPLSFQKALQVKVKAWDDRCVVTVSSTHSHHCGDPRDDRYREFVFDTVASALQSLEAKEVGEITVSRRACSFDGVGKSRISHHTADVVLDLIDFYAEDRLLAEIVLHNVHPTILQANTPYFSAEYPGYTLNRLHELQPDVFFTFIQGADGDISTRFTRPSQDAQAVAALGEKLVEKIGELRRQPAQSETLSLAIQSREIMVDHEFDPIDLSQLPADLSEREKETIGYGQIMRERLREHPEQLMQKITMSCVDFGGCRILFMPNEMFSWYLGEADRSLASIGCYSNGYGPYVTGPDQHLLTYETFTDTLTRDSKAAIVSAIREWGQKAD